MLKCRAMKLWLDTCSPCGYPSQEVYDIESLNFASFQLKLKSRLITVPRKGSLLTTVFDKRLYFSFCKVLLTGDNSSAFYPHDRTCGLMNIWFIRLLDKLFHCILPISSFNWCRKYFCILIQLFFLFFDFQVKVSLLLLFRVLELPIVDHAGLELIKVCLPLPPECCD